MIVLCALSGLLIVLAATRQDFLGDGTRHLPTILAAHPSLGEPRWLLFPPIAWTWVRALSSVGLVTNPESAIQAVLWLCVASGIAFLFSIRSWLVAECADTPRRAAALALAGCCAPVLILFSDVAEPQIAAALVACGLAYARTRRGDGERGEREVVVAIAAIALAALIYQGAVLALGMLPLIIPPTTRVSRRVAIATAASVVVVLAVMIGAQIAAGTDVRMAIERAVGGEANPLTRSLMTRPSAAKYLAAVIAGPPQGIAALDNFGGIPELWSALRDGPARQPAMLNAARLLLGFVIVGILVAAGIRTASWRLLGALAVLMVLPILRNQQYGYPKFFILWPIPVALLATRCRTRTILLAAVAVVIANTGLVVHEIRRGRELSAAVRDEYRRATPATCWLTSGWSPPLAYLWPGTTVPILGTLATGSDPTTQATTLTTALRRCFCQSDAVWTDASARDAGVVTSIARHFDYRAIDVSSLLVDSRELDGLSIPGAYSYSEQARTRMCRLAMAASAR